MSAKERAFSHEILSPKGETSPRFVSLITKNTYALVLAGGRGTRLKHLTDWRAKPAVPFGGKFRIVDFPLSNCLNSGIRRMGVVTQYKAHSLIQHIQRGWSFVHGQLKECVDLLPAQQMAGEDWYQGTADAVYQNIDILRQYEAEFVLVLAGDHVYKMDYGKMLAFHVARSADMSVACIEVPTESARDFGVMAVDEDQRVTGFLEKPQDPPHIPGRPGVTLASMGIYAFNTKFLFEQLIRDREDPNSAHDFGKNVIPYALQHYRVFAHRFEDSCVNMVGDIPYWRDVGTVDAYYEANVDLTQLTPELNLYDDEWPIWTNQAQLPPAKFVFDDESRRGAALDSMVSGGCLISGSTLRRSLLFSNVHVHSYCTIEDSVILPDVEVNRYAVLKKVILDRGCKIPPGMRIGVDPDEDRKRFHVTDKGVTLVTPEMLGQAMHLVC